MKRVRSVSAQFALSVLISLSLAPTSVTAGGGTKADLETYAFCKIFVGMDHNKQLYDVYMGYQNSTSRAFNIPLGNPNNHLSSSGQTTSPIPTTFAASTKNDYAFLVHSVGGNENLTWHVKTPSPATSNNDVTRVDQLPDCKENPLPVTLVSFTARISSTDPERLEIQWRTAQEVDNDRYEVEHSTDGKTFTLLETVRGKGTTSQPTQYSIRTPKLSSGTHYLRLKQIDSDGTFTFSQVISAEILVMRELRLLVYPNPAFTSSGVKIQVTGMKGSIARLEIISMQGRVVRNLGSVDSEYLSLEGLRSGVYIVRIVSTEGEKAQQRLVIQN